MNRNSSGRRYDREFKNNAVALVRGGRTITEVARDLGVSSSAFTLRFSRLARRSLILWPARSLIAFSATFCTEGFARSSCPLRALQLLPAGATVAGWDILPPLE